MATHSTHGMVKNGKMWLRDFLQKDTPFENSRIITFRYTSILVDKRQMNVRLADYTDELLKLLIRLRGSKSENKRPLIFICHSMGGLVARLAMTRLQAMPEKFEGLCSSECGLLFLRTSQMGSLEADRSQFPVAVSEGFFGLRRELVRELESFNPSSIDTGIFGAMKVKSLFKCSCESEPTRLFLKNRLVSTSTFEEM
jgi:hypothetical protein